MVVDPTIDNILSLLSMVLVLSFERYSLKSLDKKSIDQRNW